MASSLASEVPSNELQPQYKYPFAAAPDIIRSAEKDKYFQTLLLGQVSDVLRTFYGARYLNTHSSEIRALTELLYFGSTTFLGNRTLGEEYCDLIQVESRTLKFPSVMKRSAFIIYAILLPYASGSLLPKIRVLLERKMYSDLRNNTAAKGAVAVALRKLQLYFLDNSETILSSSIPYGFSLAVFYFTGAYYHISKRLLSMRYLFSSRTSISRGNDSYEVLGALLLVQILVQGWLHVRSIMNSDEGAKENSVGESAYELSSNQRIHESTASSIQTLSVLTHTPTLQAPRYLLSNESVMAWIPSGQQRKCTLCLEELKDPSTTTCGHVFCWSCISDWIREKPECPLCRQGILTQHVLPLRG